MVPLTTEQNEDMTKCKIPEHHFAGSSYEAKLKADLSTFLHLACWGLCTSTMIIAIKKHFLSTWPGLTEQLVLKLLPKSEAAAKGHIYQSFKGKQSTQPREPSEPPSQNPTCTHIVYLQATYLAGKFYTDQTGRLPVTSIRSFRYIMVDYDYNSNTIHTEPMKNCSGKELLKVYTTIHNLISERGLAPKMHYLDNECPKVLQQFMTEKEERFQLVPPRLHRRNLAEQAIQTFKNHFIAGLDSANITRIKPAESPSHPSTASSTSW